MLHIKKKNVMWKDKQGAYYQWETQADKLCMEMFANCTLLSYISVNIHDQAIVILINIYMLKMSFYN